MWGREGRAARVVDPRRCTWRRPHPHSLRRAGCRPPGIWYRLSSPGCVLQIRQTRRRKKAKELEGQVQTTRDLKALRGRLATQEKACPGATLREGGQGASQRPFPSGPDLSVSPLPNDPHAHPAHGSPIRRTPRGQGAAGPQRIPRLSR